MAQKKTAKKTPAKAGPAAKKKAAGKATGKSVTRTPSKAAGGVASKKAPAKKSAVKASAKAVPPAAAKSKKKAAARAASPRSTALTAARESLLEDRLRHLLENPEISDARLFATVAGLLHENLGYSALNVFWNTDPAGKGGQFELLAAAGDNPEMLFYQTLPDSSGDHLPKPRTLRFAQRPVTAEILDETAELSLYTVIAGVGANAETDTGNPTHDLAPLDRVSDAQNAPVSILYLPLRAPGTESGVAGCVLAILVNPRPRYTRADFEPATLIAALLGRNLLNYRIALQSALVRSSTAQLKATERERESERAALLAAHKEQSDRLSSELAEIRRTLDAEKSAAVQAAQKSAEQSIRDLKGRIQALEEQTGEQHNIRKELERQLALGVEERQIIEQSLAQSRTALAEQEAEHKRQIETQIRELQEQNRSERSELERQRTALEAEVQKLAGESEQLRAQISRLSSSQADEGAERELLQEELDKTSVRLKSIETEKTGLDKRVHELESQLTKLGDQEQRLAQELEAARGEAADARGAQVELTRELEKLRGLIAERDRQLSEAQASTAAIRAELKTAQDNLDARQADLQREQNRAAEQARQIESLQQDLARQNEDLSAQAGLYDEQLQAERQKNLTLAAELQKAHDAVLQKESDYHDTIYELKQKVSTLTESLERSRTSARESAGTLQQRIDELERDAGELTQKHARELQERDARLAEQTRQSAETEQNYRRVEGELEAEQARHREARQAGEALQREVDALQSRAANLEESHQRELARVAEAAKSREEELGRDLEAREASLQAARQSVETSENRIETLQRDLARLREEKGQLSGKLDEAGRTIERLRGEVETGGQTEQRLKQEGAALQANIEKLKQELGEAREEAGRLRQDIGIRREREARLEQAIAASREEMHGLNNRLSEEGQKHRELEQNIAAIRSSLESTKSELAEQYQKERKLGEELNSALAREKGSQEEGRLLANLTHAISNLPAFTDKLRYLRDNVPGDRDIERIVVYRLIDENTLVFLDGYHGEHNLAHIRGRRIAIKDTVFGQTLASLRPHRLETGKSAPNPDLPGNLAQALAASAGAEAEGAADTADLQSFLCLPLMQSGAGIGLLILGSTDARAFADDKRIRILGNVAPLFAVAVQYERNSAELQMHRSRIHNFKQVTQYQERRYLQTALTLNRLSRRLLPVLERGAQVPLSDSADRPAADADAAMAGVPDDLVRELSDYSRLAIPGSPQNAVEFAQWARTLGARVSSDARLSFEQELPVETLSRLAERIGSGFQNLYWLVDEALANVARHSQATRLRIRLGEEDGQFRLEIVDNGEGLVRTAGTDHPEHGTGLRAISNLAAAAGARVAFLRDENGHGLAIQVDWDRDENELDATLRAAQETSPV